MTEYVLLGVADELIGSKNTSWNCNKIGGKADWMNDHDGSPLCAHCHQPQILVIQIYCPLDNSKYHRSLYVFCCLDKECWISSKGWTVYRMQCGQVKHKLSKLEEKSTVFDSWGEDDDDWGDTTNALDEKDFFDTCSHNEKASNSSADVTVMVNKLQSVQLANESKSSFYVNQTESRFEFNSYYINVFGETDLGTASNDDRHVQDLLKTYKESNECESDISNRFQATCEENYEKYDTKDKLFYKFYKKINFFPAQIVRYSRCGTPVLFTEKPNDAAIPKCQFCGAQRIFEFQLMPALISYLQLNKKNSEYIEFGTVLIYTCSESCWDNAPQKEQCIYFADPDLKCFK